MRSLVRGALLVSVLVMAPALARTEEAREEPGTAEPELILPGDHVVAPGEWVELRWTRAEAISELEILLSLDGGRHYTRCISPQLDPQRCGFRWRVPPDVAGDLRMRIRFNRDGREIEGAPTAALTVATTNAGQPQPLGLPPSDGSSGTREPRPSGERQGAPGGRPAPGVLGSSDDADPDRPPTSAHIAEGTDARPAPRPLAAPGGRPFTAPRTLPMRS